MTTNDEWERCKRSLECWRRDGHDDLCARADGTIILRRKETPSATCQCLYCERVRKEQSAPSYHGVTAWDALSRVLCRVTVAREKYPNGATILALADEVGEVVHAVNKGETEERVRDELLDVAATALRLYIGETDHGCIVRGLVQNRDCDDGNKVSR